MSRDVDSVHEAIDRWVASRLIDPGLAASLRAEAADHAATGTKRLSQYLVATAGAAVLLIASGLFLDWAWPLWNDPGRATFLGVTGVAVLVAGAQLERRDRWLPASYLLQTAGLTLLLAAFVYTDSFWDERTPGGIFVGLLALATPIVLAPRAMRRSVVMPAIHLAFSLAYLAVFLDRAAGLDSEAIVWTLDVVLFASLVVLARVISGDWAGERHPWAVNAFVMAMCAGFVMVWWTVFDLWGWNDDTIYALDVWWLIAVLLTLWGRHGAPPEFAQRGFGELLAAQAFFWIFLGFYTAFELPGGTGEINALLLVGGVGVLGFVYGNREGLRPLMAIGTLSAVLALWVWAVDLGGALGAAFALLITAGALFWLSGRMGGPDAAEAG